MGLYLKRDQENMKTPEPIRVQICFIRVPLTMSTKQRWLRRSVFGLVEVAQTDANQTETLPGAKVHAVPERQGDAG